MTTPQGDLPDWQTFTAPPVLAVNSGDQPASTSFNLLSLAAPYRVWGVWLRQSMCTSSTFAPGILEWPVTIKDGAGNVLLDLSVHVSNANQTVSESNSIAVPGFTPALVGGLYTIIIAAPATLTNVFARYNGGMYYSSP